MFDFNFKYHHDFYLLLNIFEKPLYDLELNSNIFDFIFNNHHANFFYQILPDKLKNHFDMHMRRLSIRKKDVPFNYFTNNGFQLLSANIQKID